MNPTYVATTEDQSPFVAMKSWWSEDLETAKNYARCLDGAMWRFVYEVTTVRDERTGSWTMTADIVMEILPN